MSNSHEPDLPDETAEPDEIGPDDEELGLGLDDEDEEENDDTAKSGPKTYTTEDVRKLGASLGLSEAAVAGVIDDVLAQRASRAAGDVGADGAAAADPVTQDPMAVGNPDALIDRVNAKLTDLKDRWIARDRQVVALGIQDDLKHSAAELYAAKLEKQRNADLFVPTYPHAARSLIGRLLVRCEAAAATILDADADGRIDRSELGKASQLAHAMVGLVRALNDIDPPTKQFRQHVNVTRSSREIA